MEGYRGMERGMGLVEGQKKRKVAEKQRGSTYVRTAQRRSERERKQPAHVQEADGVRVREGRREG